jgi:hypothetical protein
MKGKSASERITSGDSIFDQVNDLDTLRTRFVANTPSASDDDVQSFKSLVNEEINAINDTITEADRLKIDYQNNGQSYNNAFSQLLSTYPFSPADRAAIVNMIERNGGFDRYVINQTTLFSADGTASVTGPIRQQGTTIRAGDGGMPDQFNVPLWFKCGLLGGLAGAAIAAGNWWAAAGAIIGAINTGCFG